MTRSQSNASVLVRRLERYFNVEEHIFVLKRSRVCTRGVVNFYSAGVVTQGRRIGSRLGESYLFGTVF
jgi:hypothetical protein